MKLASISIIGLDALPTHLTQLAFEIAGRVAFGGVPPGTFRLGAGHAMFTRNTSPGVFDGTEYVVVSVCPVQVIYKQEPL